MFKSIAVMKYLHTLSFIQITEREKLPLQQCSGATSVISMHKYTYKAEKDSIKKNFAYLTQSSTQIQLFLGKQKE